MSVTVLSVATRAVVEACERLGMNRYELLESAGLTSDDVFDPDRRIDVDKADAVWMAAARLAGDPDLALHAAERLPDGAYRVLDFVIANAPTVRESLLRIVRYFPIVDPRGRFLLKEMPGGARLVFSPEGVGRLPPAAQQYTFAAIVTRLRRSSGLAVELKRVEFDFPAPAENQSARRIFGCELAFEVAEPSMVFSRGVLDTQLPRANADLLAVLDRDAERLVNAVAPAETDLPTQVRAALHAQLRGGEATVDAVAKRLGASGRTLQRRLAAEGVKFGDLLADVRKELALDYLTSEHISLTEVAWLLGFSEHSAFSRAFKRWTGESPAAYRSSLVGG